MLSPGIARPWAPRTSLANRLLNSYRANRLDDWKWFERGLAYSNARLPQALMRAGMRAGNEEMLSAGLFESLDWLVALQRCEVKGHFVPIGSQGFYSKTSEKARFDQQPVEACSDGFGMPASLFGDRQEPLAAKRRGLRSIGLLGDNDLQIALYDPGYRGLPGRFASRPRE